MAYVTLYRISPLFIILTCAIWLAYATPLPPLPLPPPHYFPLFSRADNSAPNSDCTTNVDNDLYGTGVRIGLYLQWASGFILRQLESWEVRARVRTTSNVLVGAVAIATAINISQGSALSVDYLLSYYLTVVLFYAESYNLEIKHQGIEPGHEDCCETVIATKVIADFPLVFQNIIFMSFTLYGTWYWLKGIAWTADPICGARGALLGLFDIKSHAWTHGAAGLAVILGVLFFFIFLVHLTTLPKGIGSGPKAIAVHYSNAVHHLSGPIYHITHWRAVSFWKSMFRPDFPLISLSYRAILRFLLGLLHYFLIYLAGPLIAIVSVERMIAANNLATASAYGSAGQIIPLITGIVSMLLACWEIGEKIWRIRKGGSIEESAQGHIDPGPTQPEESEQRQETEG